MASSDLKCSECDRSFSMPAHLARHQSAIHASPAVRKAAARKAASRRAAGRATTATTVRKGKAGKQAERAYVRAASAPGRPAGAVFGIVKEMNAYRAGLVANRDALEGQISAIETAISAIAGTSGGKAKMTRRPVGRPAGRPVGRPAGKRARAGSLKDVIVKVLSQRAKPLKPSQISAAVQKAGYTSKAKDLTKAVSNVLPEIKQVRKVGFGIYTA